MFQGQPNLDTAMPVEACANGDVLFDLGMLYASGRSGLVDLVAAQDDSMAIGARKAFEELPNEADRDRWLKLPFTGCDGLPKTGQAWVRSGLLAATIFVPPNTGQAIEMFVQAIQQKKRPPERVFTAATSIPALTALKPVRIA